MQFDTFHKWQHERLSGSLFSSSHWSVMKSCWWKQSGLESVSKHLNRQVYSLVGFLPVGATRTGPAVVSLDYEGIFLLALAVHGAAGSQDALSRCTIQHHRFKRSVLAVDLKSTNLPWRKEKENNESKQLSSKLGASAFDSYGTFAEKSPADRQTFKYTVENKQQTNKMLSSVVNKTRLEIEEKGMSGKIAEIKQTPICSQRE